jgi:4'-phosphopantetheinyl transferase
MLIHDTPRLTVNDVHLWKLNLDHPSRMPSAQAILSTAERARAARFHFDHDRRRFIVAHCALRIILGNYLGISPSQVQFHYGDAGKPALDSNVHSSSITFNLSHSHELALVAVTLERRIGVDVERVHPLDDAARLVTHYFSPQEQTAFFALPENLKTEAFFNCWTRKEAFIKALGSGLSHPLDQFDVSLRPGEPPKFLRIGSNLQDIARWSLYHLEPAANYIGALVVEGIGLNLSQRELVVS